mgnify:FL=1
MSNIFEIQFNSSINYVEIIKIIKSLGNFTIYNNYFYLNTKYKINKIKSVLNLEGISIKLINKNNYMNIKSNVCKNWCYDIILNNVENDFEKNHQDYLKKLNTDLDFLLELKKEGKLKEYVEKILRQKEGENVNAKEETSNNKASGK